MRRGRVLGGALAGALACALLVATAWAGASSVLDAWVVTRYRGAQLFPDAEFTATSLATSGPRPRIEAERPGGRFDTLLAVHFSAMWAAPALGKSAKVYLTGPTGTMTPLTARIVERRVFRAPRTPGPSTLRPDSNWRYGWAYLAVVPHDDRRPVSRFRGWLLLDATTP
ncbi:hypothetical protein [Gemmatimonas sp.]|uniref:hypothetical protein n=1 Tax=Gemmatimonas sp. TaxID=1962908 RepID=UPI0031C82993|nr:hypothetical protein [Gemmatimonas sp.]